MNRRNDYKDLNKYRETVRRWKERYRRRTGSSGPRGYNAGSVRYTSEEDELVLRHDIPDRDLAQLINRSVASIQNRRWKLKTRNKADI